MWNNNEDEAANPPLESLSESRLDSLKYFALKTGCETIVLLLKELLGDVEQLQIAYAISKRGETKKLANRFYVVPEEKERTIQLYEKISNDIREILDVKESAKYAELNYRTQSKPYEIKNSGLVVFFPNPEKERSGVEKIATKLLCKELELSRSLRISDTIRECQKIAQEELRTQYDTLEQISKVVQSSLNCRGAKTYGFNHKQEWESLQEISPHDDINPGNLEFKFNHSKRIRIKNYSGDYTDALIVPIHRPYFSLSHQKFQTISSFLRKIKPELQAHQAVLYYNKASNNYLQDKFSSTDQLICDRVFYSIQAFLAAKDYQESYNSTLEALTSVNPKAFPSREQLIEILKDISPNFTDIGVLSVERDANSFRISVDPNYSKDVFSEVYIRRLKDSYLTTFFESYGDDTPDEIFIGIDEEGDYLRFEIHFSSHHTDTKIFVVRFREAHVTEASIRSIVHLFSELHLRYKREATLVERADYITQVRHVVVHHISSTLDKLTSIQSTWKAAERNDHLWMSMRRDVDFPRFLDQGISNLARATQILELGRFIIDEIDPKILNKKVYDPASIIHDIFSLLAFNIKKKKLVIKSTITGSKPSIVNGDEELLRIAYLNLIDNAIKYSAVGRQIDWKVAYRDDHYYFEIKSVGDPIQEVEKEKLLHTRLRSRQLDNLNQRHGTGWGLPVTAKILRAHSKRAQLDFKTIISDKELINSKNIFFFEMPYKTGVKSE